MIQEFGPAEVALNFAAFTADEVGLHRRPLAEIEAVRAILMRRIASTRPGALDHPIGPEHDLTRPQDRVDLD
jgi:hypothetical protein